MHETRPPAAGRSASQARFPTGAVADDRRPDPDLVIREFLSPLAERGPARAHDSIGHGPCRCPFPRLHIVHTARTGWNLCNSPAGTCQYNSTLPANLLLLPNGGDQALAAAGMARTDTGSRRQQSASVTGAAAGRGAITLEIPMARRTVTELALNRSRESYPHTSEWFGQRFRGPPLRPATGKILCEGEDLETASADVLPIPSRAL